MALASMSQAGQPRVTTGVVLASAVVLSVAVGWCTAQFGGFQTALALSILTVIYLSFRTVWAPYLAAVAVGALLPFLVLPVSAAGASPTLFELMAIGAIGAYAVVLLIDRREMLVVRSEVVIWATFCAYLVAAFVLGTRFGVGLDLVRLFARFGLALALFWLTLQLVRSPGDARRLAGWISASCAAAAAVALVLYSGGAAFTFRMLGRLVPYGYPDNRIVRFIEDNPELAMRATGTGVDPNAFGGLMMLGFVLTVGLLLSRRRQFPVGVLAVLAAVIGVAVLLTFSRGAWVGSAVGAGIIVWFRARVLVPFALAGGFALLAIGVGATYVGRLEAGLRGEDAATLQRFHEYRNALELIRAHPWFGIGFGDAPSPEFGVGVSSIYLLLAEQAGLVGLAIFGLFCLVVLRRAWATFRRTDDDLLLAAGATFVAALTVGLVDHYFLNIRFAHSVGYFWIVAGLVVALSNEMTRSLDLKGDGG